MSEKPVDGRILLTAFVVNVVIFGWREEFGYHSDEGLSEGNGARRCFEERRAAEG